MMTGATVPPRTFWRTRDGQRNTTTVQTHPDQSEAQKQGTPRAERRTPRGSAPPPRRSLRQGGGTPGSRPHRRPRARRETTPDAGAASGESCLHPHHRARSCYARAIDGRTTPARALVGQGEPRVRDDKAVPHPAKGNVNSPRAGGTREAPGRPPARRAARVNPPGRSRCAPWSRTRPPTGLEHKSAPAMLAPRPGPSAAKVGSAALSGVTEVDGAGQIVALVAVTGVVDDVDDVIEPGAFRRSLRERQVKGVLGHDWLRVVAVAEEAVELMPGDPRLPRTAPDGTPWPPEAGALRVKARVPARHEGRPRGVRGVEGVRPEAGVLDRVPGPARPQGRPGPPHRQRRSVRVLPGAPRL